MAKPVPSRGSDQFMVRFPKGMRDKIKASADQNGRSMNSEIIARLDASLSQTTGNGTFLSSKDMQTINEASELMAEILIKKLATIDPVLRDKTMKGLKKLEAKHITIVEE